MWLFWRENTTIAGKLKRKKYTVCQDKSWRVSEWVVISFEMYYVITSERWPLRLLRLFGTNDMVYSIFRKRTLIRVHVEFRRYNLTILGHDQSGQSIWFVRSQNIIRSSPILARDCLLRVVCFPFASDFCHTRHRVHSVYFKISKWPS